MDKEFYEKFRKEMNDILKKGLANDKNTNFLTKMRDERVIRNIRDNFDRLYSITTKEEKTGLYNYKYFQSELDKELKRTVRYNHFLSLLIMDLDNFKKVNDTFGHAKGDDVLKRVAQVIMSNLRAQDIPARFGGEEFVVLLPETDAKRASLVAEKLRLAILKDKFLNFYDVTVSIGLVGLDRTNSSQRFKENVKATPHELFKKADKALLWAKRHGKNQTKIWDETI